MYNVVDISVLRINVGSVVQTLPTLSEKGTNVACHLVIRLDTTTWLSASVEHIMKSYVSVCWRPVYTNINKFIGLPYVKDKRTCKHRSQISTPGFNILI